MDLSGDAIVLVGFVLSVVLVAWSAASVRRDYSLSTPMLGKGKYDPKNSWGLNVTLAAAVLSSGFSVGFLGKTGEQPGLTILFAAVALLAVVVYIASVRPTHVPGYDYESKVGYFLLASTLTVWAGLGALMVFWWGVGDAQKAKMITEVPARVFQGTLLLVALSTAIYAWNMIRQSIQEQVPAKTVEASVAARGEQLSVSQQKPPSQEWSLL